MNKKFFSPKIFLLISLIYVISIAAINFGFINSYWEGILKLALINIILVVSLNLATGILGQLSLAHSAFMAMGAYTSVLITKFFTASGWLEFPFAIICGGLVAMFFAAFISYPTMKIPGNYLLIITLAVNEIVRNFIINFNIAGGSTGCRGIAHYSNFSVVYIVTVLIVGFIYLLINSKYGRATICISQNELLTKSCGVDTFSYKIATFSLAAFFAGIAGGLFAHELLVIEPNMFDYTYSLELLAMVIIGGLGSISGSIISAVTFTILPYISEFILDMKLIIYLLAMILVIFYMPNGLFSNYKSIWANIKLNLFKKISRGEKS